MTERKAYLIEKIAEPEEFGEAYASSLPRLPGEEEYLNPSIPGVVTKLRHMTDEEAAEVEGRTHIDGVRPDGDVYVDLDEPVRASEVSAEVSASDARAFHGFDHAHALGYRGQGQVVAILDTGLDETWAKRLGSRLVARESMIPGEDWRDSKSGHGTWCTGCVAGCAPEAEIVVIKALSTLTGSSKESSTIKGLNRAYELKVTVVSNSWGGSGNPDNTTCKTVDAMRSRGISVCNAAGNEQNDEGKARSYNADGHAPGCSRRGVCVAACDFSSRIAPFSSWGNSVDVCFIGVSTVSWGLKGGAGRSMSGTSMATPHAAGGVAVARSKGATADAAEKALLATARDTALPAYKEGHGIADVHAAVRSLGAASTPPKKKVEYRVISGTFEILENAKKREAAVEKAGFPSYVERKA